MQDGGRSAAPGPSPVPTLFRFRFFWRLYLSFAVLVLLCLGATGVLVVRQYRADLSERLESSLRVQTMTLAHLAADDFAAAPADVQALVERFAKATQRRVTLVRRDGTVIADSDRPVGELPNHADRAEIRTALHSGHGVDQRPSSSTGRVMLYAAHVPEHELRTSGVVRVAAYVDEIDQQVASVRQVFVTGAVLASLVALVFGAFAMRRAARPLEEMHDVASALSSGDYAARVEEPGDDELGVLGSTLNRLGGDMSERVSALTAGQDRLRAMVAGMVEGVIAVDDSDRITFTNHTARRMLGVAAGAEVRGERLWEAARVAEVPELLAEARRSDAAAQRELNLLLGGREVVVRAQAHRFADGDRIGVVVVLHDISELRRLERIRRDFVANVSHELKTPLTSIRGYVETLLDGALHDDRNNARFLEKIEQNTQRLSHLVTDLLSLARIEAQEGSLPLERVDLHALVEQTRKRHEPAAVGRDQTLRLESCNGALQVLGDREALTQVLDNLVDNALKYTPPEGHITIRLKREPGHAVLEVEDDGIGIPAEDIERVFERFYRVDKARSRAVGGTGLGLSIVKHLVVAMKGEVEVESKVDEGSTFRVRLVLA
jgi:two-component system phosphate regulon sensor histidine kinase PhoR